MAPTTWIRSPAPAGLELGLKSASNGRSSQSSFSEIGVPGRRFEARDLIEVCDQAREQDNTQPDLLVREAAQYLTITPEQDSNRVRQACWIFGGSCRKLYNRRGWAI